MTIPTHDQRVVLYELSPEILDRLGLPRIPIPVRKDYVGRVFGDDGVDLDALIAEVDSVIGDDMHLSALYGAVIARLADIAGMRHALEGRVQEAADLYRLGVRHRPAYVGLNSKLALALQAMGRDREAAKHYDIALARGDELANPVVFVLAARAHAEAGNLERALDLLDRCPEGFLDDEGFRDLYRSYASAGAARA